MHFFCILEKRQVIKMMFKYELKKIFSKRMNKVLLAAVLVMTVIYSGMAIGSMSYTDADGQSHTGIDAGRLLAEDVNQWKGKLTTEKISEVINDYKTLSAKYQDEIPNTEYGKTVQTYYDQILKHKPVAIEGYPSSLYSLALMLRDRGLQLHIPLAFTSSESLLDYQRALIETQFGTQVYDHYGTTERTIRLSEALNHNGYYEEPG